MTIMSIGSGAIILLGALGLYIRHRHFDRYGSYSLAVFCFWTLGIGAVRLLSELNVLIQHGSVINSWWSVGWAWTQLSLLMRAEWTARERKARLLAAVRAMEAVKT